MTYVDPRALLSETALFKMFDRASMDEVVQSLKRITYLRSQDIFAEGDHATEMYVVARGRVAILKNTSSNKESMVALMNRGDLFGEMSLFHGQGRSATAKVLERTELLRIPYQSMRSILHARPHLLWGMVEMLAGRLRATDEALADTMFLDLGSRTAKRILDLSEGRDEFHLVLTQEELAGLIGASRERVNKALSSLAKKGLLEVQGHRYRILDRVELESYTG